MGAEDAAARRTRGDVAMFSADDKRGAVFPRSHELEVFFWVARKRPSSDGSEMTLCGHWRGSRLRA